MKEVDVTLAVCPPQSPRYPHLGVASLVENLEHHGFRTRVYDLNLRMYQRVPEAQRRLWEARAFYHWTDERFVEDFIKEHGELLDRLVVELLEGDPPCLGLSLQVSSLRPGLAIAERVRALRPRIKLIVGGPAFYTPLSEGRSVVRCQGYPIRDDPERLARLERWLQAIDLVVLGEGEQTLVEALAQIGQKRDLGGIAGTARFDRGSYQLGPKRPPIEDLDTLPFPTFSHFPLGEYEARMLPVLTARGCPRRCTFCTERYLWGQSVRYRSLEQVIAELRHHRNRHGVEDFEFVDMQINSDIERLTRFCEMILDERLGIRWRGNLIAHRKMSRAKFELCGQAGAQSFNFGVESGSSRVLARMGKGFTPEDASENLQHCAWAKIQAFLNIIVGFPRETEEDFRQTCRFIDRNQSFIERVILLSICSVFHDSDLAKDPLRFGLDPHFLEDIADTYEVVDWVDDAGLDFAERHERYDRLVFLLEDLGFSAPEIHAAPGWTREEPPALTDDDLEWLRLLSDSPAITAHGFSALMKRALAHPDHRVRCGALLLIGLTRDEKSSAQLRDGLTDPEQEVREAAIRAMGMIADPGCVEALWPLLEQQETLSEGVLLGLQRVRELHTARVKGGKQPSVTSRPSLQLTEVELLDAADRQLDELEPGSPLTVQVGYQVNRPVEAPVIRVQLFVEGVPLWSRVVLFDADSGKFGVDLLGGQIGRRSVRLTIPQLNLAPGRYHLTIGVWPDSAAPRPLDIHHGAYHLHVLGAGDPSDSVVRIPVELVEVEEGPAEGAQSPDQPIGALELLDQEGRAIDRVTTGGTLRARVPLALEEPARAVLTAEIHLGIYPVLRWEHPGLLPEGERLVELCFAPLNLISHGHEYELVLSLKERESGDLIGQVRQTFDVVSLTMDGEGVVFNPVVWEVVD